MTSLGSYFYVILYLSKWLQGKVQIVALDIYWLYLTFESNIKSKKFYQYNSVQVLQTRVCP